MGRYAILQQRRQLAEDRERIAAHRQEKALRIAPPEVQELARDQKLLRRTIHELEASGSYEKLAKLMEQMGRGEQAERYYLNAISANMSQLPSYGRIIASKMDAGMANMRVPPPAIDMDALSRAVSIADKLAAANPKLSGLPTKLISKAVSKIKFSDAYAHPEAIEPLLRRLPKEEAERARRHFSAKHLATHVLRE